MTAVVGPDTLFKTLDGRQARNGGTYTYRRGVWTRRIPNLVACERGYHITRGAQVLNWLGPDLWTVETRGTVIQHGGPSEAKLVAESIRLIDHLDTWNDRTARLFAADCAEAALLGEQASGRGVDARSIVAVEVARRFADGDATDQERAAAGDAAWDAAWDAAGDAARAAAWDAQYTRLTHYLNGTNPGPVGALYGAEVAA